MSWTPDRVGHLTKLFNEGQTFAQIAAELKGGVTRASAIGKAYRLGLRREDAPKPGAKVVSSGRRSPAKPKPTASYSWGKGGMGETLAPDLAIVKAAESATPVEGKTLAERGDHECCWPVGAPDPARGQLYCGRPTPWRKPYCGDHNPHQTANLRSMRLKDETVRRARPERDACDVELTELFS